MNGDEPTRFTESNALLAIQAGDTEHAEELLGCLLPGELRELERAADALADICRDLRRAPQP